MVATSNLYPLNRGYLIFYKKYVIIYIESKEKVKIMKTYAFSDLHRCLNFYKAIKESLEPEDRVYFLGDAGDRGPQSWETLDAILNDPQFIFIKGNHEDMLEKALFSYLTLGEEEITWSDDFNLLVSNGGANTFKGARKSGQIGKLIRQLRDLPTHAIYVNKLGETVCLSHAGFTPWSDENGQIEVPSKTDLIWDRLHFLDGAQDLWYEDAIVVHGHTPIPYLLDELDIKDEYDGGAWWYADGRKCCIDTGAFFLDQAVLIDLDTWEEKIFVS